MGMSNRDTNEKALREGLTEKARLTAEKVARERLEEQEREERMGIGEND
jgi:AAA+ superfamily predicted ATPase